MTFEPIFTNRIMTHLRRVGDGTLHKELETFTYNVNEKEYQCQYRVKLAIWSIHHVSFISAHTAHWHVNRAFDRARLRYLVRKDMEFDSDIARVLLLAHFARLWCGEAAADISYYILVIFIEIRLQLNL